MCWLRSTENSRKSSVCNYLGDHKRHSLRLDPCFNMGGGSNAWFRLPIVLLMITECLAQGSVTYTPRKFCSLKGSSVTMHCSYTIPKGKNILDSFWYKMPNSAVGPALNLSLDSEYDGRVVYQSDGHQSTLKITSLRESDSGIYRFQFGPDVPPQVWMGDSGVRLNVTGLQVDLYPELVIDGQWAYLYCGFCFLSNNPTYLWYKDSQYLNYTNSSYYLTLDPVRMEDTGNYSCAVRDEDNFRGPSTSLLVRPDLKTPSVSVSPSGEIAEGSTVTLTCSSDEYSLAYEYTWHKKSESQTAFSEIGTGQRYIVHRFALEDNGQYFCKSRNQYTSRDSAPVRLHLEGKAGFPWAPVMGVVAVLSVGSLLVIIYCTLKKRNKTPSGDAQMFSPGKPSHMGQPDDTYATLDRSNMSPEYDTLANVSKCLSDATSPKIA
ncbi:hypothetical protein DPEC_G00308110 [Dallia pectoralis]|uniref:Uncharacterized protein n=1 Tax=Dallia pectoralis TaxID=75939 RepID=A0ACC2FEK6_DALPE|nr:hypothetical protein DPEC_G00308110 [Dallia pectoralis]